MKHFKEYAAQRDEASYNPLAQGPRQPGIVGDTIKGVAGAMASPFAAAAGLKEYMPTQNKWSSGNPIGNTEQQGWKAFQSNRNWLLKAASQSPQLRQYLLEIIDQTEHYISQKPDQPNGEQPQTNIAGAQLGGKKPGIASKLAAPIAALIKTAITSLKNVIDTMDVMQFFHNPQQGQDKMAKAISNMLYGLDLVPKDQAFSKLQGFRQCLSAGEGPDCIDQDAEMN